MSWSVPGGGEFFLEILNLLDLNQKPAANFLEVENLLDDEAGAQSVRKDAFGVEHAQCAVVESF